MNESNSEKTDPSEPAARDEETPEAAAETDESGLISKAVDATVYSLSLPERVARGMIGTASSTARDLAKLAVPDAMKEAQLYRLTVEKMLGFLADDVGKLASAEPSPSGEDGEHDPASGDDDQFVVKKAVGNVIDVGGLAVLHVSPVWVLAVVSDVAFGAKTYLNALVGELKEQGVIEGSETIDGVDQLLAALQRTSGSLADSLDTPPVTTEQLQKTVDELRAHAKEVDLTKLISKDDMARVWSEIEETVRVENRSLLEVSNAVAMMTYSQMVRAGRGAVGSVKVALDLFSDNVVDYYLGAFAKIREKGYYTCVLEVYDQFVVDLRHLFEPSSKTATEAVLRGGWIPGAKRGLAKLWPFGRKPPPSTEE